MDVVAPSIDVLVVLAVVLVLDRYGWVGHSPTWLLVAGYLLVATVQRQDVQRWLGGGVLHGRHGLGIAMHVGVATTVTSYAVGWGPLLVVGYAFPCLQHVQLGGSRAWRPAVGWALAGTAVAQFGLQQGWLFTYLNGSQAQVAAWVGAGIVVMLVRGYGQQTAQREETEAALQRNEQRFRALVQHSSDMTVMVDLDGVVRYVSPAVEPLLGVPADELVGRSLQAFAAPEDSHRSALILEEMLYAADATVRTEMRFLHRDGSVRWHQVTMRNMISNPAVGALVGNHRDVTEERLAQEKLEYEAAHDLLTGLDNRAAFLTSLQAAITVAHHEGRQVAIVFIDLDAFKQLNDSLGHEAGDVILMTVAGAMRQQVLGSDVVGRLGGDEFAVALTHSGRPEDALDDAVVVAERIIAAIAQPVPVAGHSIVVDASVGIALTNPAGEERIDAAELLRRADLAMFDAKRRRGARWSHYHPALEPSSRITAEEIRTAVEDGQLYLLYQPIVSLETGRLVGTEALVRWNHPVRGIIPPVEFIPVAESYGLIGIVGDWVMREAVRQLAVWRSRLRSASAIWVGVNVAADQLDDVRTAGTVLTVLEEHNIPADRLVVEVTESALADSPTARATLEALHQVGVRIAIDDFGTGYSSLQYLTRLPVDVLKLDRAFVLELDGTRQGSAIAEAVIRLAQTLDLSTTAEGVETPEQVAELTALGYRTAQGYLFAKPLPPDKLMEMLGRPVFTPQARSTDSEAAPATQDVPARP